MNRLLKILAVFCLFAAVGFMAGAQTNVLVWHKDKGTVDANMHHETLMPLLKNIAGQTGWHVYMEAGSTVDASVKFKNLPAGDALKMLLGDLNFALVPKTDSPWQLYVFRTTMKNATHLVSAKPKHVPNQLLVKVKPGTDIDALAKMLGAKVIGRLDKDGLYQLQFANEDATDSALSQLQMDSDVQAVGYNNYYDPPPSPLTLPSTAVPSSPTLTLSPPPPSGKVVVGLIDTGVQSLGPNMDQFVLPEISDADGTPSDSGLAHGTAMLSTLLTTMGAVNGGQVPQVQPYDVYGSSSTANEWNVMQAFTQAVNNGNNPINMSLGSSDDDPLWGSLISQAASDGIVVYAASGNDPTGTPYYPAGYSGAHAVTALSQPTQPGQTPQLASYANTWPDDPTMIALPGTALVGFDNQAWVVTGTSTATAEATAATVGNALHNGWTLQQTASAMQTHFPVP
jgi:Subtilase family